MNGLKLTVIDAIMGSGKSTSMINYIKHQKELNPNEKFLIIVPYLTEIERYSSRLKGFKKLIKDSPPKRLTLEKYLKEGKDIICTHKLFLDNPELIINNAKNYTLIIDEAINTLIENFRFPSFILSDRINVDIKENSNGDFQLKENAKTFSFQEDDIEHLINEGYLEYTSDNKLRLKWNHLIQPTPIYSCLKDYFDSYDIYRLETTPVLSKGAPYYIALFPINTFKVFNKIYVMTYLWNAQIMKYYFDFFGATYDYLYPITVTPMKNGSFPLKDKDFILSDNYELYTHTEKVIALRTIRNINIPGYTLKGNSLEKNEQNKNFKLYTFYDKNKNAKGTITLSYSFYNDFLYRDDSELIIKKLQNNIQNFIKTHLPKEIKSNKNIIWSVFDCAKEVIQKNCKYINNQNYIPINAKATNEYSNANTLIYLVNRYINPHLYNFIVNYSPKGSDFSEDEYALSELVQWVWRSAIRNQKPICIYIASDRMLKCFIDWLNSISQI